MTSSRLRANPSGISNFSGLLKSLAMVAIPYTSAGLGPGSSPVRSAHPLISTVVTDTNQITCKAWADVSARQYKSCHGSLQEKGID
jgi:hypothetical protein